MDDQLDALRSALSGRYEIERKLGEGGMAKVYLAHDVRHDRQVAVKVLRTDLSSEIGADRFVREVRLAARLTHPHILPLFDSGEAGGFLYFVMPVVEGESLRERIRNAKQLSLDEARQIAMEVADALDYAHRHDVVHRDIKPENIMLHHGHAVVTDFGIGKAVTAASEDSKTVTHLTQAGVTVGTPAYMAPEQAAGEADIDGRADLFALGCVCYEMLTGEMPFTGATAQAIIARRFSYTPPPVTDIRDGIPAGVSQVVARLLARAPADRYATGSQVVSALKSGETAAHPPVNPDDKSIGVLPFANLSADPENEFFADGITEEIINALSQLSELRVAARTSSFAFKDRRGDLADVASKLKVSYVVEGSVRKAGNSIRITAQLVNVSDGSNMWSEKYDRKMDDIFAVQDEIAAAIAGRLKTALVERRSGSLVRPSTSNLEAYELYLKGRSTLFRRGLSLLEAKRLFERALDLDPDYVLALSGLRDANALLDFYGVRRYTNRTVPLSERELDADVAEMHNSVAFHRVVYEHDWKKADASFRQALEINPNYVLARCWYGGCVLSGAQGRTSDAVAMIEKAIELDPLASYPIALLSWTLLQGGRNEEAERAASEAVARDQTSSLAVLMNTIALSRCGRTAEAVELAEHGVLTFGRLSWAVANLALVCSRAGDTARAELVCNELSARAAHDYVPAFAMATAYAAVGRMDEAFAALEQGIAEYDPTAWALRLLEPDLFQDDPRFEPLCARVGIDRVRR